ncbi:MAG: MBL fold metallo-hydrolase [bacterium]
MLSILPIGCYGSDLENKKCISMQVTPSTIIDAGAIMSMEIAQLLEIKNVIITHSHFDHIKSLPMFADFMLSYGNYSFTVYTTEKIMSEIKSHVLNNLIWPDFTKLPSEESPTIHFKSVDFDKPFVIDGIEFIPIKMNHLVESMGFIIKKGSSSIAYSGDTFICENFIDHVNENSSIKTICWETSFPNRLERIAIASKHLTPSLLEEELKKLKRKSDIHVFHIKPNLEDEIVSELEEIKVGMNIIPMKQKKPLIIP